MTKQAIRNMMSTKRKGLATAEIESASKMIAANVALIPLPRDVLSLHIYRSSHSTGEVNTAYTIDYFRNILASASVDIGEARADSLVPSDKFDVIIVPLIAFDAHLHRLGFGGGWYDRFLLNQKHAVKIGLAYDFQFVNDTFPESHDIKLDYVVTPTGIVSH